MDSYNMGPALVVTVRHALIQLSRKKGQWHIIISKQVQLYVIC